MPNEDLIRAYKNTRKLIEEDPKNKDNIINEYIDLVNIINNNDNINNNNTYNNTNPELTKMFKNPLEIAIYNNFQKYNDKTNNIINDTNNKEEEKRKSSRFLAGVYDLTYK